MSCVEPIAVHVSTVEDSRRWRHVTLRPTDVVISTPPKCGTTWTQAIVASLLWPDGDAPVARPWPDWRLGSVEEMAAALDAQTDRRFLKSHCPADALPYDSAVRYVFVYRDPADAFVSWGNHRANLRPDVVAALNESAAHDGIEPIPECFDGDYDVLFEEWSRFWSPAVHLSRSVDLRSVPNALFLHYADMHADLPWAMRRIAEFLEIPVDPATFGVQVARCELHEMREAARGTQMDRAFDGGADAFFYLGGSGRGRRLLSDEQVGRVTALTASLLSPDDAAWLTTGDIA